MLRASLRRSRPLLTTATRSRIAAQWLPAQQQLQKPSFAIAGQRWFADNKKTDETVLPSSNSKQAPEDVPPPPPLATPVNPAAPTPSSLPEIPTPPPTEPEKASTTNDSVPPPPPPPKRKAGFFRRLLYLTLVSSLGYAGALYYALTSDNFHDFFTEYVPFGEDAVGYFEEMEFRKRFPGLGQDSRLNKHIQGEEKIKIPSKSGLYSRPIKEEKSSDLGANGKHMSALDDNKPKPAKAESPKDSNARDLPPKEKAPAKSKGSKSKKAAAKAAEEPAAQSTALIDNLQIPGASETVVQDVVKILNDIIMVVNADNASGKYSSAINKAKEDLSKVISDINTLKALEKRSAEDQIKSAHSEFDNAAKELVLRLEREMQEQETHFKEEYESEREKLTQSYQERLKSELEAAQKVYEQKLKNGLLEQSISLQRQFTGTLRDHVEQERNGRLGKLNELSNSVHELEKLTAEWNSVVDRNLQTQHLMVAVEAVRATLENADRPKPFVEELAALKEVASDDPVVNAAIASINPTAYQRGIPTPAQLIDRFRRVASEVRKASLLPENAGVASHLASAVLSRVMFKKQGLPVGDDVESVLTRTEILLEEGDLDAAAREMNSLNGWAKLLAKDWLGDCRKVLEVRQALDVISTEARLQSLLVD